MYENIKLVIKGFIVGLGKIIPGVSGAVLAMLLNIYEPLIYAICSIKKDFFRSAKYIFWVGIGIIFAIVFGSKVLLLFLNKYYLETMFLFIGLMLGGIVPFIGALIKSKFSEKIISVTIVSITLLPILIKGTTTSLLPLNSFTYFLSGIIDSFASIVPGISGTALLMILGTYQGILESFVSIISNHILKKSIFTLLPFFIGTLLGTILISKIINYTLNKYKNISNNCIALFMINSVVILIIKIDINSYTIVKILFSLPLLLIGILFSKKMKI